MDQQLISQSVLEKISYHVVYDTNLHEAIDYAALNGFSGIQIAAAVPRFSSERFSTASRQSIRAHAENTGVRLTLDAPDAVTSLFVNHPALKRGIRDYYTDLLEFAMEIGASNIIIHPGQFGGSSKHSQWGTTSLSFEDTAFYENLLSKNLEWLCQKCPPQISLCFENYTLTEFIIKVLKEYLKKGKFFLCWDITKILAGDSTENVELKEYFLANLPYIRQCRLHDVIPGFHTHQVIGSGSVNFIDFLIKLQRAPILDYCIDVRPREKALESFHNLKRLLIHFDEQMQHWQNLAVVDSDAEINTINRMENEIFRQEPPNEKILAVRQQITFLELTHFRFFDNLRMICSNIGKLAAENPVFVCMTIDDSRKIEIQSYLEALKEWLLEVRAGYQKSNLLIKIQALLGEPTELKKALVERLVLRIEFLSHRTTLFDQHQSQRFGTDRFGGLEDIDNLQVRKLQQRISEMTPDFQHFEQHIRENYICHHKFLRHLDIILENIGRERWNHQRKARGTDSTIRAVQTRDFLEALNSWIEPEKAEESPLAAEIKIFLGEKEPVREWLVLSLKKTLTNMIQSMQEITEPIS